MSRNVTDFEPPLALFAPDNDPLAFYRAIISFADQYLEPSGRIYVEIHHPLADETVGLFREHFPEVELRQDIHGRNRMICAHK
jgi:release factor glutamine methyltransferase